MSNLTLHLDKKATQTIEDLKKHFGVATKAEIIRKAVALLKFAAQVQQTDGELIARKGDKETRIEITLT